MTTKKTTSSKTKGSNKSVGRPTKYDEYVKPYLEEIKKWKKAGATDDQICEALNIARSTFCEYKNKYQEFSDALRVCVRWTDLELSGALYKKAMGYEYQEKKQYITKDTDGKEVVRTELTIKHVPPSETAIAMLKRNINPEWIDRDFATTELKRQEHEMNKKINEQKYWIDLNNNEDTVGGE